MGKNYRKLLDDKLAEILSAGFIPKLLLHVCCAPCSSAVLEYLSHFFEITVLYYNPNIYPHEEYKKRMSALKRLLTLARYDNSIYFAECGYRNFEFEASVEALRNEPEGGKRCTVCYALRLEETAKFASAGFDYFTTTLSVSPHKNAELLNDIGGKLAEKYGVKYLYSDFKKRDGYKRSIELSEQFGLYRQNYCGCKYSLNSM